MKTPRKGLEAASPWV